jgi:hypothetical protein
MEKTRSRKSRDTVPLIGVFVNISRDYVPFISKLLFTHWIYSRPLLSIVVEFQSFFISFLQVNKFNLNHCGESTPPPPHLQSIDLLYIFIFASLVKGI